MSLQAKRGDISDRSIVTGQTDWKHAGKFIPKERQSQRWLADQGAAHPDTTHNITIINSNRLPNLNTRASQNPEGRWRVGFLLTLLIKDNEAISDYTHKNLQDVDNSLAPSNFCWIPPGWLFSANKVPPEPESDISLGLPGNSYKYLSIITVRAAGQPRLSAKRLQEMDVAGWAQLLISERVQLSWQVERCRTVSERGIIQDISRPVRHSEESWEPPKTMNIKQKHPSDCCIFCPVCSGCARLAVTVQDVLK